MFEPRRILVSSRIVCGDQLKNFLEIHNKKLEDVGFETEYDSYLNCSFPSVEFYRDPTPEEYSQQVLDYTKRIEQETNRKYAQYEALKKEFENKAAN